ncbi:MAG: hypothetical protein J7K53_08525 [Bacteroidales bacterium]|nr:hypothetical protein [Bacteroidales bacterium]
MKKFGTILNLLSLIVIVLFFELVRLNNWNPQILVYEAIPFLVLLISYIKSFAKSGVWKFVHRSFNKLDENEKSLSLNAVRISYSLFTIFILAVLIIYHLLDIKLNMILIASFIYLAHIMPAYVLSWSGFNKN